MIHDRPEWLITISGMRSQTKAKAVKLLQNDNAKLVNVVQRLDPKHSVLSEINRSILPEQKQGGESRQAQAVWGHHFEESDYAQEGGRAQAFGDQAEGDRLAAD